MEPCSGKLLACGRALRNADEIDGTYAPGWGLVLRIGGWVSANGRKQSSLASSYFIEHTLKQDRVTFCVRRSYADGRLVMDSLQFQRTLGNVCSWVEKERTLLLAWSRCSQMEVWVTEAHSVCALLQGFSDRSGSAFAWGTEARVQWISV